MGLSSLIESDVESNIKMLQNMAKNTKKESVTTFAPERVKTAKTAVAKLKIPLTTTENLDKVVGELMGKAANAGVSYTHAKGVLTLF